MPKYEVTNNAVTGKAFTTHQGPKVVPVGKTGVVKTIVALTETFITEQAALGVTIKLLPDDEPAAAADAPATVDPAASTEPASRIDQIVGLFADLLNDPEKLTGSGMPKVDVLNAVAPIDLHPITTEDRNAAWAKYKEGK